MTNRRYKDVSRRAAADKVLHDKTFNITKNLKYDGNQREWLQWLIDFWIKNLQVVLLKVELCQTNVV